MPVLLGNKAIMNVVTELALAVRMKLLLMAVSPISLCIVMLALKASSGKSLNNAR